MGAVERDGEFVIDPRRRGLRLRRRRARATSTRRPACGSPTSATGGPSWPTRPPRRCARSAAYSTFGDYVTDATVALAERLAGIAPVPGSKVFLTSGAPTRSTPPPSWPVATGSRSGSRDVASSSAGRRRTTGCTTRAPSLGRHPRQPEGYGELVPDTATVEWDYADDLRATHRAARPGATWPAFFCEPVIGAGGVYPPPDGYLAEVRKICTELRRAVRGRRGDHRLRPDRRGVVRVRPVRARARHGHLARRGSRRATLPMGAVLVAPAVCRAVLPAGCRRVVAARLHLLRARGCRRGRAGQPRHHRAGGPARRGRPAGDARLAAALAPLAGHERRRRGSLRHGSAGGGPAG